MHANFVSFHRTECGLTKFRGSNSPLLFWIKDIIWNCFAFYEVLTQQDRLGQKLQSMGTVQVLQKHYRQTDRQTDSGVYNIEGFFLKQNQACFI